MGVPAYFTIKPLFRTVDALPISSSPQHPDSMDEARVRKEWLVDRLEQTLSSWSMYIKKHIERNMDRTEPELNWRPFIERSVKLIAGRLLHHRP